MLGNTFGNLFKMTTFGESHGPALGVVIDGCPAGLELIEEDIQKELDRRRPGKSIYESPRKEPDTLEILSGVYEGKTLGTPIAIVIRNTNQHSASYDHLKDLYRPGHADFSYDAKYGYRDPRGGGRASARETVARVAAGAVAKKLLAREGISVLAYVQSIGKVDITQVNESYISQNPLNCPDPSVLESMQKEIETARLEQDSVGGVIEVVARGVPAGLGEPVFHKLSADLAAAICSIPAVKGFEIGEGFAAARLRGSQNNDAFIVEGKKIQTESNRAGGLLGGISNGSPIVLRFALKPPSSIAKKQKTVTKDGEATELSVVGRHDPCVAPRAVPIAEAMVALTLIDHLLLYRLSHL